MATEISENTLKPADDTPCDQCGHFGALEIAGRHLCPDCIATAACGCSGLGPTDED